MATSDDGLEGVLEDVVDYVLPIIPPYEFALYVLLLRMTDFHGGSVRIGKRTISSKLGKGTRSSQGNYQHIGEKLQNLARAGFLSIGDTTREGTGYWVELPDNVGSVRERKTVSILPEEADYFGDAERPAITRGTEHCGQPHDGLLDLQLNQVGAHV